VTTVVALGGNAVLRAGDRGTAAEQRVRIRETCAALGPLLDDDVVITHGNGPQVGNELLRQERAADEVRCGFGRLTAPKEASIRNPAFDITPADLVTAFVTDHGLHRPPYDFSVVTGVGWEVAEDSAASHISLPPPT
jgi:hypothetical protein